MTFTVINLFYSALLGAVVAGFGLSGFNAQHKKESAAALAALQGRLGSLYTVAMLAAIGLPTATMGLISALAGTPTLADTALLIVLIGLGLLAAFTLIGSAMKLIGRPSPPGAGGIGSS